MKTRARRWLPRRASFVVRQGIAGLYRPRNQTLLFLTSIGLGAFLMMTLFVTERLVVSQLAIGSIQGKPNIFMIDVQPHQREGVTNIVRELGLEVETAAPLVSMRLSGINGKTVEETLGTIEREERLRVGGIDGHLRAARVGGGADGQELVGSRTRDEPRNSHRDDPRRPAIMCRGVLLLCAVDTPTC